MAGRPTHRLKVSRRDGEEITYVDYKGEQQTRKYAPLGALFANEYGGYNLVLEKKVTLDPKVHFVSAFEVEERESDDDRPAKRSKPKRKSDESEDYTEDKEISF